MASLVKRWNIARRVVERGPNYDGGAEPDLVD